MTDVRLVVTDLLYNQIGELLNVFDIELNRRLNGVDTLSFRVDAGNAQFTRLASAEVLVKVYRDGVLEFFGPVWSAEIVGGEKLSLQVNCTAPGKLLEKMVPTWQFNQMDYGFYDRQQAIASMAYWAARAGRTAYATDVFTKPTMPVYMRWGLNGFLTWYGHETNQAESLAEALVRLTAGADGMDYMWVPTEPTIYRDVLLPGGSPSAPLPADPYELVTSPAAVTTPNYYIRTIARFEPDDPAIGVDRTGTVMEYGTGRFNLAGFKFTTNREYQANKLFQMAGTSYLSSQDNTSRSKWGALDETSPFVGDDATLVTGLMNLGVSLRKDPLRRIEITPIRVGGPLYRRDFELGDYITVRATNPVTREVLISGAVRVHAVTLTYSENGTEQVAITVQESE